MKIAKTLFLLSLAGIVVHLFSQLPREVTVDLLYGARRVGLRSVTLMYRSGGEIVRSTTFQYGEQAPETQRHVVRVPRGPVELTIALTYATTTEERIELFDSGLLGNELRVSLDSYGVGAPGTTRAPSKARW